MLMFFRYQNNWFQEKTENLKMKPFFFTILFVFVNILIDLYFFK